MSQALVAERYAIALVELCDERGEQDTVRAGFDGIIAVLKDADGVFAFLTNPTISGLERRKVLDTLLQTAGITGTLASFVRLLLDKQRFEAIEAIHTAFIERLDARTGRVQATVTSAVPLDAAAHSRVTAALGKALGREVDIESDVDPALIGGLIVRVGHVVYDGSVRNHLDRIRERLLAAV
jgi:F-type H+-transporting ATPase subunit delta